MDATTHHLDLSEGKNTSVATPDRRNVRIMRYRRYGILSLILTDVISLLSYNLKVIMYPSSVSILKYFNRFKAFFRTAFDIFCGRNVKGGSWPTFIHETNTPSTVNIQKTIWRYLRISKISPDWDTRFAQLTHKGVHYVHAPNP